MKWAAPLIACVLTLPTGGRSAAAGKVSFDELLRQMTDLSALAEYPDPPYITRQYSSYDRASQDPKDVHGWFANADRGFQLYDGRVKSRTPYFKTSPMQMRTPDGFFPVGTKVGIAWGRRPIGDYVWAYATGADGRPVNGKTPQGFIRKSAMEMDPQGHVLAEMDGPGCVVRIWSANPDEAGNVRIYLNGSDRPEIDAPLAALLSGRWEAETDGKRWIPFPDPIAHERSRGWNLYFPIAYARHCKICVDKPDIYYHVNYRTYPRGTEIETFRLAHLAEKKHQLRGIVSRLGATAGVGRPFRNRFRSASVTIEPGADAAVADFNGPGVVDSLQFFLMDVDGEEEILRTLVLTARFDGEKTPQVWCPLGDFFASSPGARPYQSLPFQIISGKKGSYRLLCSWPMPFARTASFQLHNYGRRLVTVGFAVGHAPRPWTARSMHFHAKWRSATMKTRPFRDWTFCRLTGKGVFVGDMLSVLNPVSAWWGEGDEKISVDGESFPSHFGTGTEDYFGYAWCDPKPFQHAYHNQTRCDGPGNYGHTSLNRFHVLDAIPFTQSFRFDMEVWHWVPTIAMNYAATSYWYARPGSGDDFEPASAEVLRALPQIPPPFKVAGAIEGESLKVLGTSSHFDLGLQEMLEFADGQWSGNRQLWVRPPRAGEWVDLEVPVAKAGKYRLAVYLTKARDYGIVQFSLNGKRMGPPIDGFHPRNVLATGAIDLGTVDLEKGRAVLRGEVVGANPAATGQRYMWGLDCVVLRPVP